MPGTLGVRTTDLQTACRHGTSAVAERAARSGRLADGPVGTGCLLR